MRAMSCVDFSLIEGPTPSKFKRLGHDQRNTVSIQSFHSTRSSPTILSVVQLSHKKSTGTSVLSTNPKNSSTQNGAPIKEIQNNGCRAGQWLGDGVYKEQIVGGLW